MRGAHKREEKSSSTQDIQTVNAHWGAVAVVTAANYKAEQ